MKKQVYIPKVGDWLYLVPRDKRQIHRNREVEVSKVGRRYFYIKSDYSQGIKFDIKSWGHVGGNCPISYDIYASKSHYENVIEMSRRRRYVSEKIHALNDDEINRLYNLLIQRDAVQL